MQPVWLQKRVVLTLHAEELARTGGPSGVRDAGALDSALARPENLLAYGDPDLAALAAAYAYGIARNHAFVDGNKRASFTACVTFIRRNGYELDASDTDCITTWLALADGSLDEAALADWLRARMRQVG